MKKIGIVTLNGQTNYGNRLQNYALKHVLEKLDIYVDTTIVSDKKSRRKELFSKLFLYIRMSPSNWISHFSYKREVRDQEESELVINRKKHFQKFSDRYLSEIAYEVTDNTDIRKLKEYNYFITGSDQVWSPDNYYRLPIYFLDFIDNNKRVAYAPSFGHSLIPSKQEDTYKRLLNKMPSISTREEAGAKIIKDLIGKEVPILVDPTMLLAKEEWLRVSKRALNRPDTPYLLTYFLGGPANETRKKIEEIAREKNMTIINLGDITEQETYETGPSEFLDYINNASAFFTDSFHGVVFSIIFQTPFVVYERQSSGPSMYSRIETILDNFNMRDREAEGFNQDIFSMDFSGTHEVFEREYNKSIKYLKEALKIDEL